MTLAVDGLTHRYGGERAVRDVSFGVESGELVALLGPSGCGKTTIVQAIAGHLRPTAGRVQLRGTDVTDDRPESRAVGLVFQQPTLYPHMTVGENVAYGLAAHGVDGERRQALVDSYLDLVGLGEQRDAAPAELSGGQARRVELARALAPEPEVLVLDEPLSALDRGLRERLRDEIARIQRETGVTTLFVTHDQEEAMTLADRLVVLNGGRVAAVGTPRELYESPPTPFVASFLGYSNTLTVPVVGRRPPIVRVGDTEIRVTGGPELSGGTATCYVRPADLSLGSPGDGAPALAGTVTRVTDSGRQYAVAVRLTSGTDVDVSHEGTPPTVGDDVTVAVPSDRLTVFDGGEGLE